MSSPSIPPPATTPDPYDDQTWDPKAFPATISGIVDERVTLERKRDGAPFEKLVLRADDELVSVLCGRTHLAQLVREGDPRVGDGVAITCFGKEAGGNRYQYALRVDKSHRLSDRGQESFPDIEPSEAAKTSRAVNEPLSEEGAF